MSNAEIKTKLTADGSELTRALNKGITQAAGFKNQMSGLGKSIGAAFTFGAVIGAIRTIGAAQNEYVAKMAEMRQANDEFQTTLENLQEKLTNAETPKALAKVAQDYYQALRKAQTAEENLFNKENPGFSIAGQLKKTGDMMELLFTGKENTADEIILGKLKEQTAEMRKQLELAAEYNIKKSITIGVQEADLAAEKQIALRNKQRIEAAQYEARVRKELQGQDTARSQGAFDAGTDQTAAAMTALNMLEGFAAKQNAGRFSQLRNIGANELGNGVAAPKQDLQKAANDTLQKIKTGIDSTVSAIKEITTGVF